MKKGQSAAEGTSAGTSVSDGQSSEAPAFPPTSAETDDLGTTSSSTPSDFVPITTEPANDNPQPNGACVFVTKPARKRAICVVSDHSALAASFFLRRLLVLRAPSLLFIEVMNQIYPPPRQRFIRNVFALTAEPLVNRFQGNLIFCWHHATPLLKAPAAP